MYSDIISDGGMDPRNKYDTKVGEETEYCTWSGYQCYDGYLMDNWETTCGNRFILDDGTPSDNKMKHCCYCGKTLKEFIFEEEEDDL